MMTGNTTIYNSGQQRQTSCPEGMEFNRCGTACPRTCDNLGEPLVCTRQCVRGCFCAQGTILNGDLCIQPSYCASSEKPPMLSKFYACTYTAITIVQPCVEWDTRKHDEFIASIIMSAQDTCRKMVI